MTTLCDRTNASVQRLHRSILSFVGITVGELLQIPHLRLRLHSGGAGLHREVGWTHTSDLPHPWQWLSTGDLLMTNGMSFPASAADQEQYVDELVHVGTSALAIGEQMHCPALTARFTKASDRCGLPVLWIRYPMPFVSISRAVAEATLLEQSHRLMRTARIYDAIRDTTTAGLQRSRIAAALTRELRCRVQVYDRASGEPYYPLDEPVNPDLTSAVRRAAGGALVAGARSVAMNDDTTAVLVVDIPTHEQAVLTVIRADSTPLDGILLQHAATVVALELSQTRLALEHRRRAGAELMAQLIDRRLDSHTARRHLLAGGLDPATCVLISATSIDDQRVREIHVALWRHQIPHIVALRGGVAHAIVPDVQDVIDTVAATLGDHGRVGVSAQLGTATRAPEAAREATWALGLARRSLAAAVRYGQHAGHTGFSGIEEATALVKQYLSPLLAHDEQHQSDLLPTLQAFLANQRSWQKTASALTVHRQTVLYRVRKIEQLTGRSLAETSDIAELWIALKAHELLAGGS